MRVCEWRRGGTTRQTLGARLPKKMVVVDGKVVVNGKGGGGGFPVKVGTGIGIGIGATTGRWAARGSVA